MQTIRVKGFERGADLGTVSAVVGAESGSTPVNSYRQPSPVSGLPRITGGQFQTDTVSLDETGLTGITARQWQVAGGPDLGTGPVQDLAGVMGQVHCVVTCDQGTLTTPPVFVYMGMGMADHDADDAALLALVPHDEATHIAVANGNWTDAATWLNGRVPRNGACVLIPHGLEVIYDNQTVNIRLDWLRVDGTLTHSRSVSQSLLVETLVITRSGRMECGTPAAPIPANVTIDIAISNRDYRVDNRAPTDLNLARDPRLMSRGLINQGTRVMWANAKRSWLKTANGNAPMAGDTSLTLEEVPFNWQVGDTISIGGTAADGSFETEDRVLTAVNGVVVSWADPLLYDHDHKNTNVTRTDLQPAVALITRNVVIRSEDASVPAWQRGHTMDMHMHCHADIWDVEHRDLGRTVKGPQFGVGRIDGNGDFEFVDADKKLYIEPLTARSNIKSRYPMHAHFVGFKKPVEDIYANCVVRGTPGWGIVHHGCQMLMNRCVVTQYGGAGMVSETGNETGEWLDNLSMQSTNLETLDPKNAGATTGDFFKTGYGFAFRSRAIRANGNVSMAHSWGFVFYHRVNVQSISRRIELDARNVDLKDLQGFKSRQTYEIADYPIIHANDNEAIGSYGGGFFVTKEGPLQDHALQVNIKNMKTWAYRTSGMTLDYIGHYIISDLDAVAADPATTGTTTAYGFQAGGNNHVLAIVRPRTEGNTIGVFFREQNAIGTVVEDTYNNSADPRFMLVAHNSINDVTPLDDDLSFDHKRTWVTEPSYQEATTNLPFKLGEWGGTPGSGGSGVTGVPSGFQITDSVGTGEMPRFKDPMGLPANTPNGNEDVDVFVYLQDFGYWTIGGVPYVIFPLYFSDRLTGHPIKTYHGLEITGGEETSFVNNGPYILSPNAPVVGPASLSTAPGTSADIDLLALASDPDGGTLTVSDSYFAPDHGRIAIEGGVVTYTPDPLFSGADLAYFWIEDGQGNATRVDLNIMVS